jgi:tRNA-dihydrouridine synthase
MGCPQSTLCSNELGCGILKNLDKVETIAKILVEVCKPLEIKPSIKTRLGPELGQFTLFDMTKHCLKVGLKKLYVHARYLHENYTVPAHYTELESFKSFFPEINLVVNGDITEYNKYAQIITKTNCDGVLIGRTAHTHPNIFSDIKNKVQKVIPSEGNTIFEKLPFCIRITQLGCQFNLPLNQIKGNIAYLTDKTKNGGKLREKINLTKSYQELIEVFMSEK